MNDGAWLPPEPSYIREKQTSGLLSCILAFSVNMHVTESWRRIWTAVLCPKRAFSGKALKKKALKVLMYKKRI